MEVIKNFPDQELVANLRSGKRMDETIKTIYRDYFETLSWYVLNNSGSRQDAEDVFQEVVVNFIDLVQKDKFRGESTVKTFLYSLNRFTWLNELKRRGRSLAREARYEKAQDFAIADVSKEMTGRESTAQVIELVERLGENCKKILLMFYYEDFSIKEILDELHYENEQVVRNKKHKCMKQLEKMVNENPGLKETLKNILHG